MLVALTVGVAVSRPPRTDRYSRVVVDVPLESLDDLPRVEIDAMLAAHALASSRRGVAMVTSLRIDELLEI